MALNKPLAMAVQAITIKPSAETTAKGTIFCLTRFRRDCPFGTSTAQIQSIVSRRTENAPIAAPKEKPNTTNAVQTEVNGDVAFVRICPNNSATEGPTTVEICRTIMPIAWV